MRVKAIKHGYPACMTQKTPLLINTKIHTDKPPTRGKLRGTAEQDTLPVSGGLLDKLRALLVICAYHMHMLCYLAGLFRYIMHSGC